MIDPSDMHSAILTFPQQMRAGVGIGNDAPTVAKSRARRILILGMGGSAIGGDLVRSYLRSLPGSRSVDIQVNRGYEPPAVDKSTLVVASSYSGNTEETLAGYEAVRKDAGAVLAITTGGELGRRVMRNGEKIVHVPSGMQPRAALALGFFPLLTALAVKSELFGPEVRDDVMRGTEEAIALVEKLGRSYARPTGNAAATIAGKIHGRIPIIYSGVDRLDTVNLRWRGQIQENAKSLAFGNLIPEMNHNEINGWEHPAEMLGKFVAIFLRDRDDHPQVAARIDITRKIIKGVAGDAIEVRSQGESLLARIFSLIHLGDWVSYHLAMLNGVDPTPVEIIERLKKQLGRRGGEGVRG
jgi:glucose/mannose-6-phosphate isomerase